MTKKTTLFSTSCSRIFKIPLYAICFFLSLASLSAQTTYTSWSSLKDAVNATTTGGTFILKNGTYNDISGTFENMATEANPIIIKAETIGGVIFTGKSNVPFKKSSYITLEGFVFNCSGSVSTLVKLEGCNNMRITRNVFELAQTSSSKWVYIGGVWDDRTVPYQFLSHHNRIDHNVFQNKTMPGHYITVDGTDQKVQSQFDRIDHNYFKNNSPRATNEQESIRIGWSDMSLSSGYTTVEFNLFEDCDGDPEIVSVKSCDNTIRHNTFLKSYGTLSLRHGNRNRVEGNYFFGGNKPVGISPDGASLYTGGIRIYGKDHVIINNYMEGLNGTRWDAPITLTLGDAIDGESSSLTKHFRAENVLIAYNTLVNNSHGIEIGYDNNNSYSKNLANITIANNLITGSENGLVEIVDADNDQGNKITWINNLMHATGTAQVLLGATTTSFDATKVINENPNLVFDATEGIWKTSITTPLYPNAVTLEPIDYDIEGQLRPLISNPGADHFSTESVRFKPLTSTDVGPNAYEVDEEFESLYLSTLTEFSAIGESQTVTVTSNVAWTVTNDSDWISIAPIDGADNGTFNVITTANTAFTSRTGVVTVVGGALTRTLTITQAAADPKAGLSLINDGGVNDKVSISYVFDEEIDATKGKNNIAPNTLDKDHGTQWSGMSPAVGLPGEIIFDLGGAFDLQLVDYATTNGKTYYLQIWTSSTGTDVADFTNAFPGSGNLVSNADASFKSFMLPSVASGTKYVKIIGFGQASSAWNTITEIEFYGTPSLSVPDMDIRGKNDVVIHPNPAQQVLYVSSKTAAVKTVIVYSFDGRKVLEQSLANPLKAVDLDISFLAQGTYLIKIIDESQVSQSKVFIVEN
ncbi:chondroitinase-B domain-containing protein [Mariniflexile ostreae]|uniref:Chondroitinase-B domain-containing protein n=1 Tax=Mariniflexile ostreae TaxID=1520892 RepID=A0ABV5F8M2_9FLAO